MATADLKKIFSGGGGFYPSTITPLQTVASGASGDIITITPPSGKRVALLQLHSSSSSSEANISIRVDGVNIITDKTLVGFSNSVGSDNFFKIATSFGGSAAGTGSTISMLVSPVVGGVLTVNKTTGSTTNTIHYAYAYGD